MGSVSAHLSTLGSKEQDRGNTCDDGRIGQMMSPGEKWVMHINLDLKQPLPEGGNFFDLVIGGIGVMGDVPTPIEPPAGMVSWWPGDGNASDIVDGNHGTLSGDATFTQGMVGEAFSFDGTGDFVQVPASANLNITGNVTVDLWARRTMFDSSQEMIGKSRSSEQGGISAYEMWFRSDNAVLAAAQNTTGSFDIIIGPVVEDSSFHHYAYVRTGNHHVLFMDGEVVASGDLTADVVDTSGVPLGIGAIRDDRSPTLFSSYFGGIIDEVEIFNRALSDGEIRAIFEAGSAGKIKPSGIAPPAGMLSWWPGDGNANDIMDGNDGTLNGATFATGKVGQAFNFDGNDFVDSQANVGLAGAQPRSIDLWVNIAADGGGLGAIPVGYGVAGTGQLFALAITKPGGGLSAGRNVFFTGFFNDLLGFMPISLNTWHHIAVTYDGTTLAIYVDGVLDASALKSLGTIDSVFSMGKAISGGWTPFKGLIDEVELFDRALSEAEIRAIFEAGSAGKRKPAGIAPPAGMVSWWPGDGNASDIVDGNPGTIVGGATFTDGLVGQAFSFDAGLSSGITVPNSANLNPAEAITIDAWIKPTSFPNAFPTVVRKRASDSQYSLTVTDQGQVRCKLDSLVKTPRPPWAMGG